MTALVTVEEIRAAARRLDGSHRQDAAGAVPRHRAAPARQARVPAADRVLQAARRLRGDQRAARRAARAGGGGALQRQPRPRRRVRGRGAGRPGGRGRAAQRGRGQGRGSGPARGADRDRRAHAGSPDRGRAGTCRPARVHAHPAVRPPRGDRGPGHGRPGDRGRLPGRRHGAGPDQRRRPDLGHRGGRPRGMPGSQGDRRRAGTRGGRQGLAAARRAGRLAAQRHGADHRGRAAGGAGRRPAAAAHTRPGPRHRHGDRGRDPRGGPADRDPGPAGRGARRRGGRGRLAVPPGPAARAGPGGGTVRRQHRPRPARRDPRRPAGPRAPPRRRGPELGRAPCPADRRRAGAGRGIRCPRLDSLCARLLPTPPHGSCCSSRLPA